MRRAGRTLLPFALLLIAVSPAQSLGDATVYRLPHDTNPRHLAAAGDGSLWMTRTYAGVARLAPSGSVNEYLRRGGHVVIDIATGADGSIWVAEDRYVDRFDATGAMRRFAMSGSFGVDSIASAGGAMWVAEQGSAGKARIERLSADGTRQTLIVPMPRNGFGFNGLAGAADGSLWFTAGGDILGEPSVGRMTPDGQYARWVLPKNIGTPERIAAGPDGAMWFAARHAIGRISPDGQVTRFPLSGALAPHDLAAGSDGVWFTSDVCLSRIDGSGAVTTWPVPGAVQLEGIAAAPGGGFWLADRAGNVIRRITPAAPAPCEAPSVTRARGSTSATVSFERSDRFHGIDYFTDVGVRIARRGTVVYSERVPGRRGSPVWSDSTSLSVRDLDRDGEPEATLLLNWHGAYCCYWSRIFRYDPRRKTYVAGTHWWGNAGAEPVLRDLNGDRRPEFLSLDDRFESLNSFASTARPIQIWSYRRGDFRDVTLRYPRLIRRDAAKQWRNYLKYRKVNARGILPAWAADEYLLGRAASADRVLRQAAARGELKGSFPSDPQAYVRAVKEQLRKAGYSHT